MQNRRARTILAIVLPILLAAAGCESETTEPEVRESIVVSGTVVNRSGTAIPANARILVAWFVSAGSPDYAYVFGEGSLTDGGTSFRITLEEPPPREALNEGKLGVGVIIVTTDESIRTGDDLSDLADDDVIGAAGDYGIIYLRPGSDAQSLFPWVKRFDEGYGVGRGVRVRGGFDEFTPVGAHTVELIVDDIDNIAFVNWT